MERIVYSGAYSIELARLADISCLPGIELEAATLFAEQDLPEDIRYGVTQRVDFLDAQNAGRLWVARLPTRGGGDRGVVGFALANLVDGVAHLQELNVRPAHGRQGLGTALVDSVAGWATESGHSELTLITFIHVPWNAPFYRRLGFHPIGDAAIGTGLRNLMRSEAERGIDSSNRVAMRLVFSPV